MMIYQSERGAATIALAGDVMLTRKLSVHTEPAFLDLVRLLRGADAAFANFESSARREDEGYPGITAGTYMSTHPSLLEELRWLGLNMLSCANNHAYEYGEGGVLATIEHLSRAGFAHAGIGQNLAAARAPAYLDTANGRFGLVAATASYKPWARASEQRPDAAGRPGINPLDFRTTYVVDEPAFRELQRIAAALGFDSARERASRHFFSAKELGSTGTDALTFLERRFVRGDRFETRTEATSADVEANLRAIREARRQADWVVVSLHCHEFGGERLATAKHRRDLEELADFAVRFAHDAIDAGADVFACHGPHMVLGIEIYRGRPIFYGLGNFVFQNETLSVFPSDAYERFDLPYTATPADFLDARSGGGTRGHPAEPLYWQSMLPICRFEEHRLVSLDLYPIDLGHGRPRAQRGRPVLAGPAVAAAVVERVQRLSARYGAEIAFDGSIGRVRLDSAVPAEPR